jgi:glyoxylase-like metal-dependent hydrolase (beta-lactamase superfamily II)
MEIAPGIHHVQNSGANLFLLFDEDMTLIDGGYLGNCHVVVEYKEGLGRGVEELKRILKTHSHPDHTGNVAELKDLVPLEVLVHSADNSYDGNGQRLVSYLNVFGAISLPAPFQRRIVANGFLEDGQVLPILGGLKVAHAPGYTTGSVCFYLESRVASSWEIWW